MSNLLYDIAVKHGTDKAIHGYCDFYHKKFESRRNEPLNFLELGVFNGASLRTWREYFPNATIHGVDIKTNRCGDTTGCNLHTLDVNDKNALIKLATEHGPFDVILDDASHTMKHQQRAFDILWSYVKPSGMYIIEDLHTSFMPKFELYSNDVNRKGESTFKLVEALKEGKSFESAYVSKKQFDAISATVEHVSIWVRQPEQYTHKLTSNNSITAIVTKIS